MKCPECNKTFETSLKLRKFCSVRCRVNFNARKYREKNREKINQKVRNYRIRNIDRLREKQRKHPTIDKIESVCLWCGKKFKPHDKFHPVKKFCSNKCRANYSRKKYYWQNPEKYRAQARKYPLPEEREIKKCVVCGKEFKPTSKFQPFHKYCSERCMNYMKYSNYYRKHRERELEDLKRYRQTERGKYLHGLNAKRYSYSKRAKIKEAKIYPLKQDLEFVKKRDKVCVYCGSNKNLTYDHIMPLNKGGTNSRLNFVLACNKCNASRRDEEIFNWCKKRGILVPAIILELLDKQMKQKKLYLYY